MKQEIKDKIMELYNSDHYYITEIAEMVGYSVSWVKNTIYKERKKK